MVAIDARSGATDERLRLVLEWLRLVIDGSRPRGDGVTEWGFGVRPFVEGVPCARGGDRRVSGSFETVGEGSRSLGDPVEVVVPCPGSSGGRGRDFGERSKPWRHSLERESNRARPLLEGLGPGAA